MALARGEANPHPVIVSPRFQGQASAQWKKYLLCAGCEQRFRQYGEDWVLSHCCRGIQGPFRLHEILLKHAADLTDKNDKVFFASKIPEIDSEKLLYFGISVFWRASIAWWYMLGHSIEPISLGKRYEEELRQFLLGNSGFPSNAALCVWIADRPDPWPTFHFPVRVTRNQHQLNVNGIGFQLALGNQIPDLLRKMSISQAEHPILLSNAFENRTREKMTKEIRARWSGNPNDPSKQQGL